MAEAQARSPLPSSVGAPRMLPRMQVHAHGVMAHRHVRSILSIASEAKGLTVNVSEPVPIRNCRALACASLRD